jgi:hypothetical protein
MSSSGREGQCVILQIPLRVETGKLVNVYHAVRAGFATMWTAHSSQHTSNI